MYINLAGGLGILGIGIVFGIAIGWTWRSFQFGIDRDCANPEHPKNDIPYQRPGNNDETTG